MAYTTIDDPEAYFQVKTYTGDGSTPSITLDGDTDMQPDMVWIKNRDATDSHCLFDSVRTATEVLHGETSAVEATDADTLTSFDSDGFALGADVKVNTDTEAYVAWNWKESATAGFDIVNNVKNDTDVENVSHNLSAVPHFIIGKSRTGVYRWICYHKDVGNTHAMYMGADGEVAKVDSVTFWNDTTPTSSVFTLGADNSWNGTNIFYVWTDVQGFSKFGSYTGNGNADGPFVYTGFRPAFILCKSTSEARNWFMYDTARSSYNVVDRNLYANKNEVEYNDADYNAIDILSNGFKFRNNDTGANNSGEPHIFMAFAEAPFVNSNGVPCNAR